MVFRSPAVFKPYEGRETVATILRTVGRVFEDFRYTDELEGDGVHALIFEAKVGDRAVQGMDLIRPDGNGQIAEFTVMIRPATGLIALAERMGPALQRPASAERGLGVVQGPGERELLIEARLVEHLADLRLDRDEHHRGALPNAPSAARSAAPRGPPSR